MRRLRVEYLNVGLEGNADTALLRFIEPLDVTTELYGDLKIVSMAQCGRFSQNSLTLKALNGH
jgi:hypothetical protein